jgi:hypothetical protein
VCARNVDADQFHEHSIASTGTTSTVGVGVWRDRSKVLTSIEEASLMSAYAELEREPGFCDQQPHWLLEAQPQKGWRELQYGMLCR